MYNILPTFTINSNQMYVNKQSSYGTVMGLEAPPARKFCVLSRVIFDSSQRSTTLWRYFTKHLSNQKKRPYFPLNIGLFTRDPYVLVFEIIPA